MGVKNIKLIFITHILVDLVLHLAAFVARTRLDHGHKTLCVTSTSNTADFHKYLVETNCRGRRAGQHYMQISCTRIYLFLLIYLLNTCWHDVVSIFLQLFLANLHFVLWFCNLHKSIRYYPQHRYQYHISNYVDGIFSLCNLCKLLPDHCHASLLFARVTD